ncbi:MAG: putative Ig domain-containing protein [Acidimicrobiales bacterium]
MLAVDVNADGVTPNDIPDADGVTNYPTITRATADPNSGQVTVEFDFYSDVAGRFIVETFANGSGADSSGFGEAEEFASAITINHTGSGAESFSDTFAGAGGVAIAQTATPYATGPVYGPTRTSAVASVNNAPTFLNDYATAGATEGTALNLTFNAIDLDFDKFDLVGEWLPPGLGIDPTTGQLFGSPSETSATASPYMVAVTVTDGKGGFDTDTFVVTVSPNNVAPTLSPPPDEVVPEGFSLALTFAASDPDQPVDTLQFSATGLPSGATLDAMTGDFSWTPTEAQGPGSFPITITVTDDAPTPKSDSATFIITVTETNQAPSLSTIADWTVDEGVPVSLLPFAYDADIPSQTLVFSAGGVPAGATFDPTTGAFDWTPGPADGGAVYLLSITVTDSGSPALSHTQNFSITVNDVPPPTTTTTTAPTTTTTTAPTTTTTAPTTTTTANHHNHHCANDDNNHRANHNNYRANHNNCRARNNRRADDYCANHNNGRAHNHRTSHHNDCATHIDVNDGARGAASPR